MIDLRFNYPLLSSQSDLLQKAINGLTLTNEFLEMVPLGGFSIDRQIGAKWLSRPQYPVEPDSLLITCSGHNALTVICLATNLSGHAVIVDPITYNGFIGLASLLKITLISCPIDQCGILPDILDKLCANPDVKAIYLMPTIHNPLAFTIPLHRREEIVRVARKADLLIIDDDAYGFLDPNPPLNFAHLAPERAFFIYSFSKPVAPGVKTAYIITPPQWQQVVATTIRATGSSSVTLFTRVLSDWITTGIMERLIKEKRQKAVEKQSLVEHIFKGFEYSTQPTSYHIWVPLNALANSQKISELLLSKGVDVVAGDAYQVERSSNQKGIRIALGNIDDRETLIKGLTIVAEVLLNK